MFKREEQVTLYNADCLEKMKEIPDKSIDAIICDLPYGTTQCSWDSIIPFDKLWEQYKRIRKDNTPIVLFGSEPFSTYLRMSNIKEYKYDWIWDKKSTSGFLNAKKQPLKRYEIISVFSNGKHLYYPQMVVRGKVRCKGSYNKKNGNGDMVYGKFNNQIKYNNEYYPTNILEFSNANQNDKIHPTQKPVALLGYLIKTYSNEGDLILDNCSGSGTTAVACHELGRRFICIEKDKDYYEQSKERLWNVQRQMKLF
jgi:site-specific DNA-methyltransferase (adenine-specific)